MITETRCQELLSSLLTGTVEADFIEGVAYTLNGIEAIFWYKNIRYHLFINPMKEETNGKSRSDETSSSR